MKTRLQIKVSGRAFARPSSPHALRRCPFEVRRPTACLLLYTHVLRSSSKSMSFWAPVAGLEKLTFMVFKDD